MSTNPTKSKDVAIYKWAIKCYITWTGTVFQMYATQDLSS